MPSAHLLGGVCRGVQRQRQRKPLVQTWCSLRCPPCHAVLCWLQVTNPATGQVLATLPKMKSDETLTAIAAAHAVFPQWSNTTAKERGALLRK